MSTTSTAFELARTLLNDDNALVWTDATLLPKMRQAHGELVNKFALNSISTVRERTALITVLAGALDLGVNFPTDVIEPIKLDERAVGDPDNSATPMGRKEFLPNWAQSETLRIWVWIDQAIKFLGATADRQVRFYYVGDLAAPLELVSTLPIKRSEFFLGPRIAALVAASTPELNGSYAMWNDIAVQELSNLVRTEVKGEQALPTRRRPFSSRYRRGRSAMY